MYLLDERERAVREGLRLTDVVLGRIPPMKTKRPAYMYLSETERMEAESLMRTDKNIKTLNDRTWLNDEVINTYMELLTSKKVFCWNTFFWLKLSSNGYSYNSVRKWATKKGVNIGKLDRMLVPMNIGKNHWALGIVDFKRKTIAYYDSLAPNTVHSGFVEFITKYIADEVGPIQFSNLLVAPPQQSNSFDCGVFTCMIAECLAAGRDWLDFDQSMIPDMRRKIAIQIAHNSLY